MSNKGQCLNHGILDSAADPDGNFDGYGPWGPAVINKSGSNNPANNGNTPFAIGVVCTPPF